MLQHRKKIELKDGEIGFNSIQSLHSATITNIHMTAYLKTIIDNQAKILSKLNSLDEDIVFEEISQTYSEYLKQTVDEWKQKKWIDVAPKE